MVPNLSSLMAVVVLTNYDTASDDKVEIMTTYFRISVIIWSAKSLFEIADTQRNSWITLGRDSANERRRNFSSWNNGVRCMSFYILTVASFLIEWAPTQNDPWKLEKKKKKK